MSLFHKLSPKGLKKRFSPTCRADNTCYSLITILPFSLKVLVALVLQLDIWLLKMTTFPSLPCS